MDWIAFLGGIGVFLYGMHVFEEAIHNGSWKTLKKFIQKWTTWRIRSILTWVFATTILQSSTLVSFIILGFIWSGMISLYSGISAIVWANVGTVLSNWIVVFFGFKMDLQTITLPIIAIGSIWYIFIKNNKYKNIAFFLLGFGLLLMWLGYMKDSMTDISTIINLDRFTNMPFIVFVIVGMVITMLTQSSSATNAIILTAIATWQIDINIAAGMVLGANIWTTSTALLASLKWKTIQKQVAASHFFYNLTIVLLWLIFYKYLLSLAQTIAWKNQDPVIITALFNTLFNVSGAILFTPILWRFTRFISRVVPDRSHHYVLAIEQLLPGVPEEAIIAALRNDSTYILKKVMELHMYMFGIEDRDNVVSVIDKKNIDYVSAKDKYNYIKEVCDKLYKYILNIDQSILDEQEKLQVEDLHRSINNAAYAAKFLKDIARNTIEIYDIKSPLLEQYFSQNQSLIITIHQLIYQLIDNGPDPDEISQLEDVVDRHDHIDQEFLQSINNNELLRVLGDYEISSLLHTHRYLCLSIQHIIQTINLSILDPSQRIKIHNHDDLV